MLLAGFVFLAAATLEAIRLAQRFGVPLFDWVFYSAAVQRWLAGEPIYPGGGISTLTSAAGASYAYPPSSVPLFLPFASWPLGALAWEALLVAVFWSGLWTVVSIGWPLRRYRAMAVVLLAAAAFIPNLEGIGVGNINIATAGALGWMWTSARPDRYAPGILASLKVFPFALAVPGGRRSMARAAAIVVAVIVVTLPLVGVVSWVDYVNGLRSTSMACAESDYTNFSLACALLPVTGATVAKWAGLVVAAVFLVLAARAGRSVLGAIAVIGAIMAPAIELHAHYLSLVFMVTVIAVADLSARRRAAAGEDPGPLAASR